MKVNPILPGILFVRGRSDKLSLSDKLTTTRQLKIGAILNMWRPDLQLMRLTPPEFIYVWQPLPDGSRIPRGFIDAGNLVARWLEQGKPVIVQCHAGRNRSCFVAALAIMRINGWSGEQALEYVRQQRPDAVDNPAMEAYLDRLDGRSETWT